MVYVISTLIVLILTAVWLMIGEHIDDYFISFCILIIFAFAVIMVAEFLKYAILV